MWGRMRRRKEMNRKREKDGGDLKEVGRRKKRRRRIALLQQIVWLFSLATTHRKEPDWSVCWLLLSPWPKWCPFLNLSCLHLYSTSSPDLFPNSQSSLLSPQPDASSSRFSYAVTLGFSHFWDEDDDFRAYVFSLDLCSVIHVFNSLLNILTHMSGRHLEFNIFSAELIIDTTANPVLLV